MIYPITGRAGILVRTEIGLWSWLALLRTLSTKRVGRIVFHFSTSACPMIVSSSLIISTKRTPTNRTSPSANRTSLWSGSDQRLLWPVHYVVEGDVHADDIGDVGDVGVIGLRSDTALVRLFPSKLSMENGFSLFLSSLPFTERSMLPLWTSSSLVACLIRFLPPLLAGWRPVVPTATNSRRRSSKLKPQWWIPGWWFKCSIVGFCGFFRDSLDSLALLLSAG